MRKMKSEFSDAEDSQNLVILRNIPHQGLIKANRTLLLIASVLMIVVFVLGFLLMPEDNLLGSLKAKNETVIETASMQNPALSAEINTLKGQLVGLISGSIESKLRSLETSVRQGSTRDSLGTIQDLKNDVKVLQAYSVPEKKAVVVESKVNQALLEEVSQLKRLIFLTVTSCGLMFAAIAGVWMRRHYRLDGHSSKGRAALGRRN